MNPELQELLTSAVKKFNALSPAEKIEHLRLQRKGFVRAELSWPKPQFHYEGMTKVYHSYEDYLNG